MRSDQQVTQYAAWTRAVGPCRGPWTAVLLGSYAECERELATRTSSTVQGVVRDIRDDSPERMSQYDRDQALALVERERISFAEALAKVMADRI